MRSVFCAISLAATLGLFLLLTCTKSTLSATTPNAPPNNYATLLAEVVQWQTDNQDKCGLDTPTTCGVAKLVDSFQTCKTQYRVINGCDVEKPSAVGWQVGIILEDGARCSGVLVSNQHVLLAAHCVDDMEQSEKVRVFLNTRNMNTWFREPDSLVLGVASFGFNPAWNMAVHTSDTGFLKLSEPVTLDVNGIRAACIPTAGTPLSRQQRCLVSGYGTDDFVTETGAGKLRYTMLKILDEIGCQTVLRADPKYAFCALGYHQGAGSDSCAGDSGSGVLCQDAESGRWIVRGIVSYGTPSCGEIPSMYADVARLGITIPSKRPARTDTCKVSAPVAPPQQPPVQTPPQTQPQPQTPPAPSTSGGSMSPGAKKTGGVSTTLAETLVEHGCETDSNCDINMCKPVALCTVGPTARPTPNFPSTFRHMQKKLKRRTVSVVQDNDAATDSSSSSSLYARANCSLRKLCWTREWQQKSFLPKVVFDNNNNNNKAAGGATSLQAASAPPQKVNGFALTKNNTVNVLLYGG